jgi:hypothetical protein
MHADPKPEQTVGRFDSAVVEADPRRPEPVDPREMQRRVFRAALEKGERLGRELLNFLGKGSVAGTRSQERSGDSKFGGPTGGMRPKRTFRQRVELPCFYVRFELPVPQMRVELGEPAPELRKLLGRQLLDLLLEIFDFAHALPRQLAASVPAHLVGDRPQAGH